MPPRAEWPAVWAPSAAFQAVGVEARRGEPGVSQAEHREGRKCLQSRAIDSA